MNDGRVKYPSMDAWFIPIRLIISFILGAVIGLEREVNEKKTQRPGTKPQAVLGLRSFSLITSLGTIVGFLYPSFTSLSLLIGAGMVSLFVIFYILDTNLTKDTGITTEFAMLYSFTIGILLAIPVFSVQIVLALAVVFILILSRKRKIKDIVEDIRHSELNAIIAFALIALVILPFLPNTTYAISDFKGLTSFLESIGISAGRISNLELFNPFRLWFIVVLITGVDLAGYILEKAIGQKKGWILTSIVGGFVSSTATTQSLAQQSKASRSVNHLVTAALLANLASFIQIAILLSPINPQFMVKLIPALLILIVSILISAYYFLQKKEKVVKLNTKKEKVLSDENIFEIGSAIKFAIIYIGISIVSKIALEFFGSGAFLVTTALGAFAGLDAVMINTAQLAGSRIDFTLAVWAFLIANAVNLTGKVIYSFLQGKSDFAFKFAVSIVIAVLFSFAGLIVI